MLHLSEVIEHASHVLPAQGPINVFIHHNTLHAFENLEFNEAVKKAAQVFGCQPYMSEDRYREALRRGRIRFDDLREVLERDLGSHATETIPCFGSRLELRLAMLQYPLRSGPTEELVWYVAETNALRRIRPEASSAVRARLIAETRRWVMRDLRGRNDPTRIGTPDRTTGGRARDGLAELIDRFGESTIEIWSDDTWEGFTLQALWRVCCDGVRALPPFTAPPSLPIRHRDLLLEATGVDTDALVHDVMIPFCAAFLDQGLAHWSLPRRDAGFHAAFCSLYRQPLGSPARWTRGLARELGRLQDEGIGPLESVHESLELLGVAEGEWEGFISATFLALRGWGGMVREVEIRGDRAVHPVPAGSLVEFLAVRLILDRFALVYAARTALGITTPLSAFWHLARGQVDRNWPPSVEQRAFLVFQMAQIQGLSPDLLHRLSKPDWAVMVAEIESFSALERRRIFHLAYEQRLRTQTLDAIALHAPKTNGRPLSPSFQVSCCLDEREESFRRHLEELAPSVETFGVAGFYNVAMYYRGAADAHFVPLCPVVIRPRHWVAEEVRDEQGEIHRRRARTRRVLGTASHHFHVGSRSFALGAVLTGGVGVLASVPLVARILFPRLTAKIRQTFGSIVRPPPFTRLQLERVETTAGPENGHLGFTVAEMIDTGERLLRDIGLTHGFARLVILIGHGSDSLNNPYNSAYNCGACGGSAGGPNARVMAQILNDPRVREGLARRGLPLPPDTVFVGGYHNTCNDSVIYYDRDRVPGTHREEFEAACEAIESACDRNAHERCRRFMSAPLTMSFPTARQHVEERSEDLAQTRPELGHATNAITIVGRREWSRGLFLDRRAFLTSYDPSQDDAESSILTRILQAVFPVCGGINLEYYFSNVDNVGYGAGTKLPHNLAALLGVMDGAASDLRTGLPWQMVEIHEPVRSLFVIETTTEAMLRIMERDEGIGRFCRNGWVQLAVLHPETREISVFQEGAFRVYQPQSSELPRAPSSVDWYRGWRDHLEFAEIEPFGVEIERARRIETEPMPDNEHLLKLLGMLVVVSPFLLTIVLGLSSLLEWKLTEEATAKVVHAAISSGLLAAVAVLGSMLFQGTRHVAIDLGDWVVIPHRYHFSVKFLFDRLSVPLAILSFVLSGTIGAFATRYMHRERGYNRFFVLYAIFVLGMVVTSLAGTIETLFAGWELVGLSSALLVAFFQERAAPARNGLWVWVVYRVSDAALLLAAVAMHHLLGEGDFNTLLGAGVWPDEHSLVSSREALVVGLLLLVAAAGKSALVPFSGWLPRAMEGPTPSSAVFYGALSVHLGAFLLLRVSPLLERSVWLSAAVVALGLTTAMFGYLAGCVQTDIKSALSFASLSQVGVIVAEIGFRLEYIPLIHLLGHACLRTLQFVRAPTLLQDYRTLENAIGARLPRGGAPWGSMGASRHHAWLYRLGLEREYLDSLLRDYVVVPFVRTFQWCDAMERRWTDFLSGEASRESDQVKPHFGTIEEFS